MSLDDSSSYAGLTKWQRMQTIVSQHPTLLQSNPAHQFKKLFITRLFAENIVVFLLQYTGLMISAFTPHPSPLWLASGTACAFIFMRGYSVLPGIWLGSLFAYTLEKMSFGLACGCSTLFALQAALLLWTSHRYISLALIFYRKQVFVKFILFSCLLTAVTSLGLEFICSLAWGHSADSFQHWLQGWLANFNGILIVACALTAWDVYFPQIDSLKRLNLFIVSLSYGSLLIVIMAYLFSGDSSSIIWFASVTLPIILFISTRYGWCGAISAIFLLGMLLTFAAFFDAPMFTNGLSSTLLSFALMMESIIGLYFTFWQNSLVSNH